MNLRHLTARTAVAGVTTALAAGALVGIATPAANAATASNIYTCTVPVVGAQDATLTVTGEIPVPQYSAGAAVPAGIIPVTASVDATTAGLLGGAGAKQLRIDDFALALGKGEVPIPLSGPVSGTPAMWAGKGNNKAFVTPDAGANVAAKMPKSVTVIAPGTILGDLEIPCTLKAGTTATTVASITLTKQAAFIKAPKSVKGKVHKTTKVKATVAGAAGKVLSGKVIAKEGKKKVGSGKIKNGKVVVMIKKLKAGKHKLVLSFAGNGSFKAAKAKTKLVVKK